MMYTEQFVSRVNHPGSSSGQELQRRRALETKITAGKTCRFQGHLRALCGIVLWGSDKSSAKGSGFVTIPGGCCRISALREEGARLAVANMFALFALGSYVLSVTSTKSGYPRLML
jgi:hypothetical protein